MSDSLLFTIINYYKIRILKGVFIHGIKTKMALTSISTEFIKNVEICTSEIVFTQE